MNSCSVFYNWIFLSFIFHNFLPQFSIRLLKGWIMSLLPFSSHGNTGSNSTHSLLWSGLHSEQLKLGTGNLVHSTWSSQVHTHPWSHCSLIYMFESESGVVQSYPTLCDPLDCSPPGSSIHGILQARILEWVAISFSRGSSQPSDWTQVSHIAGRCFNLWATREAYLYV